MATIMQVLDITIANVSLPYMQGSLSATLDQVSWVLTSYVVAAAVMTAPVGWLATRFGIKKLLITCVTGFTVASMLCGIAQNIEEIVLFRVLQGMFGAALVPLSQSVMLEIYPPERRGWAMSLWGMGVMIGPIMGPILGGWLTEYYSWRWVFFINLPFGIATALGLLAFMDETEGNRRLPFDWFGFAALSIAIGALQLMLDRGEQLGWFDSKEIVVTAIVSAAAFYFFIAHSLTTPALHLLRDLPRPQLRRRPGLHVRVRRAAGGDDGADGALAAGRHGLSDHRRRPAARHARHRHGHGHAGGRPADARLDARLMFAFGLACCTVSLYYSIDFAPDTAMRTIVWISMLQGFGLGFMFVPLNTMALSSVPPPLRTQGTAMWTLIRNLGSSIGVSVVIANLTNKTIMMHARLAESVTPFNQALADPAAAMLDPSTETGRALLENLITQQATIIAYANDFKLMMLMTLLAFPLILLIRVQGPGLRPAPAAAVD